MADLVLPEQSAPAPYLEGGAPQPLGASLVPHGVNFAVYSAHARSIELCLFDPAGRETARLELPSRTGDIWHGLLPAAVGGAGTLYGYRVHGPYQPAEGHRFNPAKLLDDPCATALEDISFSKDLRFGSEFFAPLSGESIFRYSLPYSARFVVTGDFDGDGKQEIAVSTGKDIKTYLPAVDLQPLWELKDAVGGEQVWMDTIDLNGNGRDELVITMVAGRLTDNRSGESLVSSIQPGDVVSVVYELVGSEFRRIGEMGCFLRKAGTTLIGQLYSSSDGFKDGVFAVVWNNGYKPGEKVKLPRGITIYDYVDLEDPDKEHALFTYDEKGYLNIFNDKGIRIWRSGSDTGGFITTFKKPAPASYVEAGEWSINSASAAGCHSVHKSGTADKQATERRPDNPLSVADRLRLVFLLIRFAADA